MALEKWTLQEIADYLDLESEGSSYWLQVPKFQRKMVWPDDKITKLVDSIYRGFPIGSLLVYQTDQVQSNKIVLQLVDGLQRSTSIAKFLKSPLKYAPIRELIPQRLVVKLTELKFGKSNENLELQVFGAMKAWFNSVKTLEMGPEYSVNNFARAVAGDDEDVLLAIITWNLKSKEIETLLGQVLTNVTNVTSYAVPLNVYQGPVENVPTIFERVNSQGTALSKYEILAASWIVTDLQVDNIDVVSAIHANYMARVANGEYEIEDFDESAPIAAGRFNLYEYLFGLGKVLSTKFPTIFPPSDKPDEISPIAFQIFTLAYKYPVARMGKLDQALPKDSEGLLLIAKAEKAILEAAEAAENALKPFLSFKLNSVEPGNSGIKQNQAISYVTSYLANVFEAGFVRKANGDAIAKSISENIPSHFLIDLLRDKWSGSGDSTLFERTWERVETASGDEEIVPSAYYLSPGSKQNLEEAFTSWHSEQLDKKQKVRVAYPKDHKPVLKFIYGPLVSHFHAVADDFELEHILPVAYLKNVIRDQALEGLAMGALGNLMLLPKDINRIKKSNLIGDWLSTNSETPAVEAKLQSYLISPTLAEITERNPLDEQSFRDFCEQRANAMVQHISNYIKLTV